MAIKKAVRRELYQLFGGGNVKEVIQSIFDILQELDMKPTPHNVSIMDYVYQTLRNIYTEMGEKENAE